MKKESYDEIEAGFDAGHSANQKMFCPFRISLIFRLLLSCLFSVSGYPNYQSALYLTHLSSKITNIHIPVVIPN